MNLFKRPGRPGYYARWQVHGKDIVRATGETKRAKAVEALQRFVAESKGQLTIADEFGRLMQLVDSPSAQEQLGDHLSRARRLLFKIVDALPIGLQARIRQEVARELQNGQDRKLNLADGWSVWCENPNREFDPKAKTLAGYEAIWKRFRLWASTAGLSFLHEVTKAHAEDYSADLWKSKVSPNTFNQHIKFLRGAFSVLEARAGLLVNPWAHLKSRKKKLDEGRRNLSEIELKTVLTKARGNMGLMFHIGLFTGLRLGDVVTLRWENIEFDPVKNEPRPGFIVLVPLKTNRFNKKVDIPIHPVLAKLLAKHKTTPTAGKLLFPKESVAYHKDSSSVTKPIQEFFESCCIKTTEAPENGHRRRAIVRVGFHSLRHSFVSLCAKAKTPLHVVQKLVGHGSPLLTADVYLHLDSEQKREAIASLPKIAG